LRCGRNVQFQYPPGQVVTALAAAGLRVDFLNEHDFDAFQRYQSLERHGREFRFPAGRPRVPMMYSLRATRPAWARAVPSRAFLESVAARTVDGSVLVAPPSALRCRYRA